MPEERVPGAIPFIDLALERFKLAAGAESEVRREALDDFEFRIGNQWPQDVLADRNLSGRPCLTMNRLPQFVRQVTNEQRQSRPSIQINPVGDESDVDTAEVLQGIVRHVEVNSDADIAYDTAFEHMVTGGFGYFRIVTEYVDEVSDQQEIRIKRIKNPFTVYFDPTAIEPDYSDAKFAFVIMDMSHGEYKSRFPKSQLASLQDMSSVGNNQPEWANKDTVRVAEYWYVEETYDAKGRVTRKVKQSLINAVEKLFETEWLGKWIGIIPVLGDDLDVNGKRHLAGMVRNAKDAMRMYNYWNSAATEAIALAPKAPFIAAAGQVENYLDQWKQANRRNLPVLTYDPQSVNGTAVPPPQRNVAEPPIMAMSHMIAQAENDLYGTTGIYPPSLGKTEGEQSGKAVLARQKQSDVANLNYSDNLARSLRHAGRLILDLIPRVYDAARAQRIVNPDSTVDYVGIYNSQAGNKPEELKSLIEKKKIKKIYDIGVGTYDVAVSVGPSYQSKRQEAVASMMALVQAYPNLMPIAGDLLVRSMDWPNHEEVAERMKKMLPPQLQDDGEDPEQQVNKLQANLAQLSQQHELLTQALNQANETINSKKVETDSKERIEKLRNDTELAIEMKKLEVQILVAEITTKAQEAKTRMDMEAKTWAELHGAAHEAGLSAQEHGQALEQGQQQAQVAADQQQAAQAHEQDLAAMPNAAGRSPAEGE